MDTVTQVSIKFRKEKKVNKNMGISIDHNTNHTEEGQTYGRGHAYTKRCIPKICFEFAVKKKENKKVVMNTKPKTNHAAFATQLERRQL